MNGLTDLEQSRMLAKRMLAKNRLPKRILLRLYDARDYATFERMLLERSTSAPNLTAREFTGLVRETTRLYRESYLLPAINAAIKWAVNRE